jgi:hypothetical protein
MKLLHGVLAIAGAVVLGLLVGWWQGAGRARADEQQKQGEVLVASNRTWLARMDSIKAVVVAAQLEASAAAAGAADLRRQRKAIPPPPSDASAEARAAYWQGQAVSAENEADSLRVAYEAEKRASAALRFSKDTLEAKLQTTSHALSKSLDREQGHRKLLGFIPRPPKLLAAAIGCTAGALLDHGDPARGCGLASAAAVVVLPTR